MPRKPSPINLICLLLMAILMLPVVNVEAGHTDQPAIKCICLPEEL